MRKTRKQNVGHMAEAQRRVNAWITVNNEDKPLDLTNLKLTSLPTLPNNLKELNCSNNKLTNLLTLPDKLIYLNCTYNQLTSLPTLPHTLETLWCFNNKLLSLPNLPSTLEKLWCFNNKLTSLPTLPNNLKKLECLDNYLPSVYYKYPTENELQYINRIRELQKSRKNVSNTIKSHTTEKKRNVFANTTYKNMPRNVVKEIANYMNEEDLENINIKSLKPSNVKRKTHKK
jgi:Leucine-rich repeat (LRR) protein